MIRGGLLNDRVRWESTDCDLTSCEVGDTVGSLESLRSWLLLGLEAIGAFEDRLRPRGCGEEMDVLIVRSPVRIESINSTKPTVLSDRFG